MAGLLDRARSGRPAIYAGDIKQRILRQLEMPPPPGQATWDGGTLAKALGISDDAVWRILRKEGVQLRRHRSWCVSTDPQFAAKAADIIGLYLSPPQNARVLCVDEKPSIQALERRTGYVRTSSGKIVRGLKSTYKRHGVINLFAALPVFSGVIQSKTTSTKKRPDFQAFLDEVIADVPADKDIHIILDNYSTNKKNDDWLAQHPNTHFHFTPTSASWLNQVEIWFGILSRKTLTGQSFENTAQLIQAIEAFVATYNQHPTPFVWRKRQVKGSQLRNTITNLCN
jgi:transposase